MKTFPAKRFFRLTLSLGLASAALTAGCLRWYRYDAPRQLMHAPNTQVWAAALRKSPSGYRVTSTTILNGQTPLREKPTTIIASGTVGNWQWEVKAVPSVVPLWSAWQARKKTKKVLLEAERSGNWSHAAVAWDLAFERAHRVAEYLLGHPPLP